LKLSLKEQVKKIPCGEWAGQIVLCFDYCKLHATHEPQFAHYCARATHTARSTVH